jgi:hypothetical protein
LIASDFDLKSEGALIDEMNRGGSAKPPPPVQIRAAPPHFLSNLLRLASKAEHDVGELMQCHATLARHLPEEVFGLANDWTIPT